MNVLFALPALILSGVLAEPDARQIHDAAVAAAGSLTTASYRAVVEATGQMAAGVPTLRGTVIIAKGGSAVGELPARFAIDAQVSDPTSATDPAPHHTVIGFNGKTITLLDHHAREFQTADLAADPTAIMTLNDPALNLLVWNFIDKRAWGEPDEIAGMRYGGRGKVNGVACDIVIVDHKLGIPDGPGDPGDGAADGAADGAPTTTFAVQEYVGVDDHLLRKLEMSLPSAGPDAVPSALIVTIAEIAPLATVDEAAFTPAVPEGYAVRHIDTDGLPEVNLGVGDEAPAWTLKGADGKERSLADSKGRVVVLDFWATWCPPCVASMPAIQKLHEQFKDRGVDVLGINVSDDHDPAAFMKSKGYTYGLLLHGEAVAEAYGVSMIPQFFVIGVDGKIIHHSAGGDEGQLAEVIEKHLKEHAK